MSERSDADDELPAIAGIYVEVERYRRLVGLEAQVRAAIDALHNAQKPEDIAEALRLAIEGNEDVTPSMSTSIETSQWELYQALAALIEATGWKPPA